MKRMISLILSLLLLLPVSVSAFAESGYLPGVYEVAVDGFGGAMKLAVEVSDSAIVKVDVLENKETQGIGTKAIDQLPAAFVAANSAAVDGVAGATVTSEAMKAGVEAALKLAAGEEQAAGQLNMADGVYTGTAAGYKGPIAVSVTVADNAITGIEVVEHAETGIIGGDALPILTEEIVKNQSLSVDTVTGATVTSNGFLAAMNAALAQAGTDTVSALKARTIEKRAAQSETVECDVLIVGAGMAGLCAAIEAADQGANVVVLEKLEVLGGSTARSEGYVMGAGTPFQKANGVEDDTVEKFFDDVYSLYQIEPMLNKDLLKKVCYDSDDLISFLLDNGVEFNNLVAVSTFAPRATPRNHVSVDKGSGLTRYLQRAVEKKGIEIVMGTPATQIIKEDGRVVGVKATNKYGDDLTYKADATILCAGSYGANLDMVKELNGNIRAEIIKGCGDGDAFVMAQEAGAQMLCLDYPQLQYYFYWNGVPKLPVYPASAIAPVANILLTDGVGNRVANEADFNFEFIEKVFYSGQQEGYCIVGQKFYEQYPEVCEAGLGKTFPVRGDEIAFKADTVEELAVWAGLNPETLKATVDRYNELCDLGEDKDFNKNAQYMERVDAPYYILKLPAVITDGYSGVKINENAQVISTDGEVIPGFYAAGCCAVPEISCVNYYGCGTSIATCGVFGRAAAQHACGQLVK